LKNFLEKMSWYKLGGGERKGHILGAWFCCRSPGGHGDEDSGWKQVYMMVIEDFSGGYKRGSNHGGDMKKDKY